MSITRIVYFIIAAIYLLTIPTLYYLGKITPRDFMYFIGVIPLGVIALYQEQLKRWYLAPKLRIHFNLADPFCSKTPFYLIWMDDKNEKQVISTEAYYFRVGIINSGKTQAKLCEVMMYDLEEQIDNKWSKVKYFIQVNLRWDRGKSEEETTDYVNINPSPINILCDVGHIYKKGIKEEDASKFHLDFKHGIGGYHPRELEPNKKYRFKIAVLSENSDFIFKTFEFNYTGNWKDKPEEMFKEIHIT